MWTAQVENDPLRARTVVVRTLQHWQTDPDLINLRDPNALANLPDDERTAWQSLWAEVASLIERADKDRP